MSRTSARFRCTDAPTTRRAQVDCPQTREGGQQCERGRCLPPGSAAQGIGLGLAGLGRAGGHAGHGRIGRLGAARRHRARPVQDRRARRLRGRHLRPGAERALGGDRRCRRQSLGAGLDPAALGSPEADEFETPHVKVFNPDGEVIKEIGAGTFSTVLNEIAFCPENGKVYIPEYGEKIWEIDGIDGELKLIAKDLFIGDHRNGGITCRDGAPLFRAGAAVEHWLRRPRQPWLDRHPGRPVLVKHDSEGWGTTPHDPPCRDIVHTGLNVRSSDGRLTGGYLPVGVPAPSPAWRSRPRCPAAARSMRVAFDDQGEDGIYAHEDMEVYAMGFRNQSGVEFGPKGSEFETALAVSDNGANDLGNRRVSNGAREDLADHRDGPGCGLPLTRRASSSSRASAMAGRTTRATRSTGRTRTSTSATSRSCRPCGPTSSSTMSTGTRGVPHIIANPNPDGLHQPHPGMGHQQPDRRHRLVRQWLRQEQPPVRRRLRHPRHRTREPRADLAGGARHRVPRALRRQVVVLRPQYRDGSERLPGAREPRAAWSGRTTWCFSNDGKTMYIVDYGEVFTDFEMPSPFYTVPGSGVIWTVTRTEG